MEKEFLDLIKYTGYAIESFGVVVVLVGSIASTTQFLRSYRQLENGMAYKIYRQNLGRAIILGLEFLIAGDIIRTVVVADSLRNVAILGLIVVIRAFLSVMLQYEIEERLPWQRKGNAET
ncbi:Uncharacterized membrane protein [Microbulbifer donghaiensis]|uniref:Uncharacterized membrane protein n=1 Tax=Microbulbifer donghaiensis TaxID=494016 RepID=A0A1M5FHU4_9GAMM|nr:DUF1622 domain-containing protein [Microbulbifer donghaiensis]SHF91137.1 Uncharacterized membrane protein [Microbulbifer donghaiensis]